IVLINPSGILFSAGSRVDVGALTASTLNMSNQDFLAGHYRFTQDPAFANAAVVNQGVITAGPGGYVALLGAAARNEGVIQAQLGSIALAAGRAATLDMRGDGLIQFVVSDAVAGNVISPDGKPLASYVSNTGTLQADGGMVTLQAKAATDVIRSVVNQEGVIRATSLVNHGGVIKLLAADDVENSGAIGWQANLGKVKNGTGAVTNYGTLDVSAGEAGAAQGQVTLAGEYVGHAGTILARGADQASGGRVLLTSSKETVVTPAATIDTSGVGNSSAGNVIVWSDQQTTFSGNISAKGGEIGGSGGAMEVSGKEGLDFSGTVDASAAQGALGSILLDPQFLEVKNAGGAAYSEGVNNLFANSANLTKKITATSINALNANVTLQANDDVTVTDAINIATAGRTLTVQAGRSVLINANITTNNAAIAITANETTANGVVNADRDAGAAAITMATGTTINAG